MTRRPARRALARLSAAVAIIAAAVIALSGCVPFGPAPAPSPTPTGLATPLTVAPLSPLVVPAVLDYCPLEAAVHYSGYWIAVDKVYICRADGHHDTDGVSTYGPWETAYRIPHPQALLTAYQASDARASDSGCDFRAADPLLVWVHHDGVTTAYYAPVDGCGKPAAAAREAYELATRIQLVTVDRGAPDISKKDVQG